MDVNTLFIVVGFFLTGVFVHIYIPKYVEEKAKNLATKQDIDEITRKTEEVKIEFQKEFESFSADMRFKGRYRYKQYSKLYSKLYAIISQSEYLRSFYSRHHDNEFCFEEYPFLEVEKKRIDEKLNLFTGEILERQVIKVNDSITSYNKKELSEFIISNAHLASQRLLKVAVAYRFANSHYDGGEEKLSDLKSSKAFNEDEIMLLRKMISIIILDYNNIAKSLNLEYNSYELETGLFDNKSYNNK